MLTWAKMSDEGGVTTRGVSGFGEVVEKMVGMSSPVQQ